jgi:hypothetical protein
VEPVGRYTYIFHPYIPFCREVAARLRCSVIA